jgi:hypothetical protein
MVDLGTYKDRFDESGQRVFEYALEESVRLEQHYIAVEHILNGLAAAEVALFNSIMRDLSFDPSSVKVLIEKRLEKARYEHVGEGVRVSPEAIELFKQAITRARAQGRAVIGATDLFMELTKIKNSALITILGELGVKPKKVIDIVRVRVRDYELGQEQGWPVENIEFPDKRDPYRLTGTSLGGRYYLRGYAGGGGMGAVYHAVDTKQQKFVAVKLLKPDIVERSPEYVELFESETKNIQNLDHPHIVKVFDSGRYDEISYMVMEWIEGTSLEEVITKGQLSIERLSKIFEQICSAVATAHEKQIIHLDIKPANILLLKSAKPDDYVKVIDFGLSRVITREVGTTVTKFRGTDKYCAPEQFGGRVSHRSDIYSLGATLYHLICGVLPFGMSYINAKINPNLELPEIPSVTRQRDVPAGLDLVISKALSKDPKLRQGSALQLFEEFKSALTELPPINVIGVEDKLNDV